MLGFILLYFSTLSEKLTYHTNNQYSDKDFHSGLIFIVSAIGLFLIGYTIGENIDLKFLVDFRFYIWIVFEFLVFYSYRKVLEYNSKNYTVASFTAFSTIYLVPIVNYIYIRNNLFEVKTESPFSSLEETIMYSIFFFILTVVYFYDKLANNQINAKKYILVLGLSLVNTIIFATNLVQSYNGYFIFAFLSLIMGIMFLVISVINKEKINIKEYKSINTLYTIFLWNIVRLFDILAMSFLATDFVTLFRRTNQIISGITFDYFNNKKLILLKKDFFVVVIIIITSFYLYYR